MCKYCDNLDVTGRGQNIAIRKDDLYRDFMQLICFPKTEMRKKKSYAIYANLQSVTMYANINFCPMCGRNLTEDK